jgi:hypothetical protein
MITLLLVLIVVGFGLYLLNGFVPMSPTVKSLINAIVIFVLVIYVLLFVLDMFGLYHAPMKLFRQS